MVSNVSGLFFGDTTPSLIYTLSLCNVNLHAENTTGVTLPLDSFVDEIESWSLLQFLEVRFLDILL